MKLDKIKSTKKKKRAEKATYNSPLRDEQAKLTQTKIQNALYELFQEGGGVENITFKAVSKKASITEMTVFRYYPERSLLLKSLWEKINNLLSNNIVMPNDANTLLSQNKDLHIGFDENPSLTTASITTPQGREMRANLNEERRKSFIKIINDVNPTLDSQKKTKYAAILQLLHSAYSWDSLKQQWNLTGSEIAEATSESINIILDHIKKGK